MLEGLLKVLRTLGLPREDITIMSQDAENTILQHRVNAIFFTHMLDKRFYKNNLSQILLTLRNADLIMIGSGTLLEDRTPQALIHYTLPLLLGKIFRKRVVLFAVGVEKLSTLLGKEIVRRACSLADGIYVRDRNSYAILRNLGVDSIKVTVDPAAAMTCEDEKPEYAATRKREINPKQFNIGISIRECPWDHRLTRKAQMLLVYSIPRIADKKRRTMVTFFCSENDIRVATEILPALDRKQIPYKTVSTRLHDPLAITALIKGMDLFISMRLHPLVTAVTCGIPSIALSYMDKVRAYCEEVRIPFVQLDSAEQFQPEELYEKAFRTEFIKDENCRLTKNKQSEDFSILKNTLSECLVDSRAKSKITTVIGLSVFTLAYSVVALFRFLKIARTS